MDKHLTIASYVFIGLSFAILPILKLKLFYFREYIKRSSFIPALIRKSIIILLAIYLIFAFLDFHSLIILFNLIAMSIVTCLMLKPLRKNIIPVFFGFLVSTKILWWISSKDIISSGQLIIFDAIAFLFIYIFISSSSTAKIKSSFFWLFFFGIIVFLMSFSTNSLLSASGFITAWHHWGAYISPSELLLSGAAIFHDFPAQYGLGPTLIIAEFCGKNCWSNMYYIVAITSFIFSISILYATFKLIDSKNLYINISLIITAIVMCFLYTGYPPNVTSPITTPSVSGLRFLPVTLLFLYLYLKQDIEIKNTYLPGHLLWALGFLWSPESAFYVTFLWFPYYLFIKNKGGQSNQRIKLIFSNIKNLFFISVTMVTVYLLLYNQIYHVWPTWYGFFAYVINPPGELPISWKGSIWIFLIGISLMVYSLITISKNHNPILIKQGYLILLLNYGVFSYFLGRSHDNNILNLMPFIFLLYLYAIKNTNNEKLKIFAVVFLASSLGSLAFFGWNSFFEANKISGSIVSFDIKKFSELNNFSSQVAVNNLIKTGNITNESASDLKRSIAYIESKKEAYTIINGNNTMNNPWPNSEINSSWSAINNLANYNFIPSKYRQKFLQNTSSFNHRSGWVIVDKNLLTYKDWVADFDAVYNRSEKVDFNHYFIIHYLPK